MNRDIDTVLEAWKQDERRRPLLIRGARQVGKSYTIHVFGQKSFDDLVVINFEQRPEYRACFDSLDPKEITASISILAQKDFVPGRTLLFLDEIQECPRAITALRYFYEQMPHLHVIGAGSLLEFALASEGLRMPVGRIQYLYMPPLSFGEFLDAMGEHRSREFIQKAPAAVNPAVHEHLISWVKKYMVLGGMPAVVSEYISSGNLNKCQQIQTAILQTYRDDFGKYANRAKHKYLQKVFYAVPRLVSTKFKYSRVDADIQSRDLKEALELLEQAGIVHRVKRTSGAGLPLEAAVKDRHFKVVFLDVGLMQNICGSTGDLLLAEDLMKINAGAVAEQFVAQELLAYQDSYQKASLYYWAREARNSSAEVDYLVACGPRVVPVEVKSGKTGTLRSMHLFLEQYTAPVGVRISTLPFHNNLPILSIPFYAIASLRERIEQAFT
ncbi:MAG: AAA family ATPase [bacterium]|nr:AAA family ATPase [bacterium]